MTEVLARNLSNKAVMGSDGAEIGTLHNITTDIKTGHLHDLIIEPHEDADQTFEFETDGEGNYKVPARRIQAVKDYIVVEN